MVFPAGKQTITATQNGAPIRLEVMIDEQSARAMQAALTAHIAAGVQRPFFDFDHEGKAASGWPTSFYWKADGVYASVEWSAEGAEAVSGKTYRAFSPAFFIDDSTPARVKGAPFVMGGLVNDPAFRRIAPLWAKEAATAPAPQGKTQEHKQMTPEEIQAAAVKAAADKAAHDAAILAKNNENEALKAQLAKIKKDKADAAVQAAVARGALKAEDTAIQAKWSGMLLADESAFEILASLPGKAAPVVIAAAGVGAPIGITTEQGLLDAVKAFNAEKDPAKRGAIYCRSVRSKMLEVQSGLAEILAANAFGTVTSDLIVLRALDLLKIAFPVLSKITTDFTAGTVPLQGQRITSRIISVPSVVTYDNSTGWPSSDVTATDVPVTIGQPVGVQIELTTTEVAGSNRDLFAEQVEACHYALGKNLVDALYAVITQANFSGASKRTIKALASFARSDIVDMGTALSKRYVSPMGRTLLLNSDYFGAINKDSTLVTLSALLAAGPNVVTKRALPNIADFEVIEATNLPANAFTSTTGTLQGFGFTKDALVMATRVPEDYTRALPGASNGVVSVVTNPDTGISVQKVDFVDHKLARAYSRIAMSYGVAKGQVASGQCLTET